MDHQGSLRGHLYMLMVGFPSGSAGKESACNEGDLRSIPGLGRPPGEGKGYSLQYSGLENSMGRRAWQAVVHGSQRVGHDQNFHAFFLSLTPTAVHQRVLSAELQKYILYFPLSMSVSTAASPAGAIASQLISLLPIHSLRSSRMVLPLNNPLTMATRPC